MAPVKLTDTVDNTKIVYLYVKEFDWLFPEDKENNVGQPKRGRVYQAAQNTDTHSYRLFYTVGKETKAIFLPVLTSTNEEDDGFIGSQYTSNIIELTRNNILECNITEEDMDSLAKWVSEDNASIKQMMGFGNQQKPAPTVTPDDVVKALRNNQERQEAIQFLAQLNHLRELNPPVFTAISDLVAYLVGPADEPTVDSMVETEWVGFSRTLGAGKNLADAMKHLSRYGGENRRTNLMQSDLLGAIKCLLVEQARRNYHGITNE